MKSKRIVLFRALAVLVLLLIAGCMLIIGRGHTVYLDNKTTVYDGKTYDALYKAEIYVEGEKVAKLYEKERGSAPCIGQTFAMILEITPEKGDEPSSMGVTMSLPYTMDGIVVNLPALLAGLPQDAYLSEFVSAIVEEEPAEEVVTDEFGILEPEPEA